MAKRWSPKFKTYWCVVDSRGTAYLSTARVTRSLSIAAWLADADKADNGWKWWRRAKYVCQRVDVKIRNSI